jgi:16S rRNA (guanine1207-N2)-methyltransferase
MRRAPYELSLEARVSGGPAQYQFRTADGVCSKQSFRPAELQLLEHLWDEPLGDCLCLEANYGVVGTVLAGTADAVRMTESSARAATLCERNARRNDADATVDCCGDLATLDDRFDTVAYAPRPYTALAIGKQRIADALAALRPGGHLWLSAATETGLARYEACLQELASSVETVATDGTQTLLRATRPASVEPRSYVEKRQMTERVDGVDLPLVTVPGLFSAGSLDDGTRLLLETASVEDGDRVLDLCCGYGPVGVYAGRTADCDLWLSDDDRVATTCAERSLAAAGVDGTVVTADCLDGVTDQCFDRILCNPPTHAGEDVLTELFAGIDGVLAPGGQLTVVHHRALDLQAHLSHCSEVQQRCTGEEHAVVTARA